MGDDQHWKFVSNMMGMHLVCNPLHIEAYAPVVQMEAEIIRMVLNLFNGDESTCGIGTSGGTESILLAMLAYREQGRARGVTNPNIVCSETAHSSFNKAAHYFGLEIRKAKLTKELLCDVAGMKRLIDSNTVCLVSSGPECPFGNFDPLPEIAALAHSYNIGCHYDCCIGLINVFAEEAGFKLQYLSDFRVFGVTSISSDTHKYGFGPKGYSVCMFRTA
jgi:sphinganine-1-phosphate aldolase